jgi:hypothetical protein
MGSALLHAYSSHCIWHAATPQCRCLTSQHVAKTRSVQAIKAREDALERLRIAAGRLNAMFGGGVPSVLPLGDPLVRVFYRLVGADLVGAPCIDLYGNKQLGAYCSDVGSRAWR